MADFNITIDMQSLTDNIDSLATDLSQSNTYTGMIGEALEPAERRIRAETPSDTGELRETTRTTVGSPPRQLARLSEPVPGGTTALGLVGWDFETEAYRLRPRAIAREFGTIHQPARPVLIPTLNREANNMLDTLGDELMSYLNRNTRR